MGVVTFCKRGRKRSELMEVCSLVVWVAVLNFLAKRGGQSVPVHLWDRSVCFCHVFVVVGLVVGWSRLWASCPHLPQLNLGLHCVPMDSSYWIQPSQHSPGQFLVWWFNSCLCCWAADPMGADHACCPPLSPRPGSTDCVCKEPDSNHLGWWAPGASQLHTSRPKTATEDKLIMGVAVFQ